MQKFSFNATINSVPKVVLRDRHVLILLKNAQGNFILGKKNHYPEGIARMVGGGVEADEKFLAAAVRELHEEVGIAANPQDLTELLEIEANITVPQAEEPDNINFTTAVYFYQTGTQTLQPSDDLDGLVELSETELEKLIQNYYTLPTEVHPIYNFAWFDYGQIYGKIHEVTLQTLREMGQ